MYALSAFSSCYKLKECFSDATLITQRFHFARVPHQYKHVLGWYRLLKELRDNGVNAICIFDGDDRSVAKLQEVRIQCSSMKRRLTSEGRPKDVD